MTGDYPHVTTFDIMTHEETSQAFPFHICILAVIKNQRQQRVGNETDLSLCYGLMTTLDVPFVQCPPVSHQQQLTQSQASVSWVQQLIDGYRWYVQCETHSILSVFVT